MNNRKKAVKEFYARHEARGGEGMRDKKTLLKEAGPYKYNQQAVFTEVVIDLRDQLKEICDLLAKIAASYGTLTVEGTEEAK